MRNIRIWLITVLMLLSFKNFGQTNRTPLSEKSIVKDSLGTVYPYNKWFPLISNGDYKLEKSGNDEYLLVMRAKASSDDNRKIYGGSRSGNFVGKKIRFPYMTDLDGKGYSNSYLKDKIVVLNFWFVKCLPCKVEIPKLNQIYWKYREAENVVFLGICLDSRENIGAFMKTNPFVYKLVSDGRDVADYFNVKFYPTNVIVEKGIVKYCTLGYTTKNVSALETVLKDLIEKDKE